MQHLLIAGFYNLMKQLGFQTVLQSSIAAEPAEEACFVSIANADQVVGVKAAVGSHKNRRIRELRSDSLKNIEQAAFKQSPTVCGTRRILNMHGLPVEKHDKREVSV